MKKLAMAMAVVFLGGMAGLVWGQETQPGHDPIGPLGGKQEISGNAAGNGADDPTAVENNSVRKAGGTQMTTKDKAQITGNLNAGTGAGAGKVSKAKGSKSAYFSKYDKATNTYSKWMKVNGKTVPYTGGTKTGKVSLNNSTISGNGGKTSLNNSTISGNGGSGLKKADAVDSFSKENGLQKQNSLNKNELVPAVKN